MNLFSALSLTAIEFWLISCIIFIFLSLLEFGILLKTLEVCRQYKIKKAEKRKLQNETSITLITPTGKRVHPAEIDWMNSKPSSPYKNIKPLSSISTIDNAEEPTQAEVDMALAKKIDNASLIILPLLFMIFNAYYWHKY